MAASTDISTLLDSVPLVCSCALQNADEHTHDCDLDTIIDDLYPDLLAEQDHQEYTNREAARAKAAATNTETWTKRRKHRDTMARLRERFRKSIEALQVEQEALGQSLHAAIADFDPKTTDASRLKLQLAYYELVKEQLAMQDERKGLDDSYARRVTYARLVQRGRDESMMDLLGEKANNNNPHSPKC